MNILKRISLPPQPEPTPKDHGAWSTINNAIKEAAKNDESKPNIGEGTEKEKLPAE